MFRASLQNPRNGWCWLPALMGPAPLTPAPHKPINQPNARSALEGRDRLGPQRSQLNGSPEMLEVCAPAAPLEPPHRCGARHPNPILEALG